MSLSDISIKNCIQQLTKEQLDTKLDAPEGSDYEGWTVGEFIDAKLNTEDLMSGSSVLELYDEMEACGIRWPFYRFEAVLTTEYCRAFSVPILDEATYRSICERQSALGEEDLQELMDMTDPSGVHWNSSSFREIVEAVAEARDNPLYAIELRTTEDGSGKSIRLVKRETYDAKEWAPTLHTDEADILEELQAYRRTGLKPAEIQEAVDLFRDTNRSVPEEIVGWVKRASFHARRCVELVEQIETMGIELAGLQIEANRNLREELIRRLEQEKDDDMEPTREAMRKETLGPETLDKLVKMLSLDHEIVEVFRKCDFNLTQTRALSKFPTGISLLACLRVRIESAEQICYSETDIRNAIYDVVHELEEKN